jgi:hypothetical protein
MARIARIVKSMFKRRAAAPGKAVVLQTVSQGGEERTVELFHPPGISSGPTPDDRVAVVPIGSGAFRIAVATHNYRVEVEPGAGETIIYSTNAAGDVVKAKVTLAANGNIEIDADGSATVKGQAITVEGAVSVTLKTGDALTWMPNILTNDPVTGIPHGGAVAGILKLKGA